MATTYYAQDDRRHKIKWRLLYKRNIFRIERNKKVIRTPLTTFDLCQIKNTNL